MEEPTSMNLKESLEVFRKFRSNAYGLTKLHLYLLTIFEN